MCSPLHKGNVITTNAEVKRHMAPIPEFSSREDYCFRPNEWVHKGNHSEIPMFNHDLNWIAAVAGDATYPDVERFHLVLT